MTQGIYIVANDRVYDNAIALLSSIRLYDPEVPIYLIPFDDNYQKVADTLGSLYNVQIFPNLEFLKDFTQKISEIFDRDFLKLPNKMRKLAVWFGPLEEFIYIDTDIIVFEKISDNLEVLKEAGFFCCDYHYKSEKLRNIFSPFVLEQGIFNSEELQAVFNSGFWGSKKGLFSLEKLYEILQECAQHREYFDFSSGVTDQPILNYLVLKLIPQRCNLSQLPEGAPGSWAGSKHFQERDFILYDQGKRLKYLHWAGQPQGPGGAYWKLWKHYRYLNDPEPTVFQGFFKRLLSMKPAQS